MWRNSTWSLCFRIASLLGLHPGFWEQQRDGGGLDPTIVLGREKGELKATPNHYSNYGASYFCTT